MADKVELCDRCGKSCTAHVVEDGWLICTDCTIAGLHPIYVNRVELVDDTKRMNVDLECNCGLCASCTC